LITACGCMAGMGGSLLASKTIESFIYGVSRRDPVVLGAAAAVLLCVAAVASIVPAMKAAHIDPLSAIRYE